MVRHASLFSQLVAMFNRQKFYELVFKHNSALYSKGFGSWGHFVAMLFCQLAQAKSLREICGGLACCMGTRLMDMYLKRGIQVAAFVEEFLNGRYNFSSVELG